MANSNSPLDFFRRHKGLVMGTMLLSMVLFVVGGSLDKISSGLGFGRQNPANKIVFTWSDGKVSEQEMMQMRQAHAVAANFIQGIMQETQKAGGTPLAMPFLQRTDEEAVVHILLHAEKGKRMGIVISDEAVTNYINDLSGHILTKEVINDVAEKVTARQGLSVGGLMEQLKHELLAQQAQLMLVPDNAISLAEAWDYHNRLYRRVKVVAYPIQVADFLAKVDKEPTEVEKHEMFDKYRFDEPDPRSPNPGFFRPRKLSFDYVKVDSSVFQKQAEKEITEEEIKKEYDTGVERGGFKVPVKEEKPGNTKPEDKPATESAPSTEEKPADKPEGDKPAESKPEDKPADAKPEDKPESTEPKACQEDEPKKEEPAADKKEEPAKPADPAAKPEDPAAKPEDPADPSKPADPATQPPPPNRLDVPKQPEMRVQTLDEVRDQIRTTLARPKAEEAKNKVLDALIKELSTYAQKHLDYTESKKAGGTPEELKPLDVKGIGSKFGFEAFSTPLVNRYEVMEYPIGKEGVLIQDFRSIDWSKIDIQNFDFSSMRAPFADVAFRTPPQPYEPQMVSSSAQPDVDFLFWATGSKPSEQPKYEDPDVQKQLIAAWKHDKAVELAKAEAAALAKKIGSNKPLKDGLLEEEAKKLISPPLFSWFTTGSLPAGGQEPRPSEVEGIPLAGEEFLEPVCTAQVGEIVVANDIPRAVVYAVEVSSQELTDEALRQQFYAAGITQPIVYLSQSRWNKTYRARLEELIKEFSFQWNRAPNSAGSGDDS